MPGSRVILRVVEGQLSGRTFVFSDHDVFLFGRDPDCHVGLPKDPYISRHHFMLELNPPRVTLRDLNSMNGTTINGMRYGGRIAAAGPVAPNPHEPVALVHGDRIQVGQTVMKVEVVEEIPAQAAPIMTLQCTMCGGKVSAPAIGMAGADYLCERCSAHAAEDPANFLKTMVKRGVVVKGHAGDRNFTDYHVLDRLGEGGMSSVHLAECGDTRQKVVLKVLHSRLAGSKSNRETFLREMLLLSGLQHPNVVQYRDYGSAGSTFFFVVEYCNSGTLLQFVKNKMGGLPWERALPFFRQVLMGLAHAHAHNVVHRDLKPDNIFLHDDGVHTTAKVGDFGLAKIHTAAGLTQLTQPKEYAGCFHFMARDQLTDFKFAKPAADIWSASATFYYVLTGQFPREIPPGKDPIDAILDEVIRPIGQWNLKLPPRLAEAIDRGLASDPAKRWESAEAYLHAMERAV